MMQFASPPGSASLFLGSQNGAKGSLTCLTQVGRVCLRPEHVLWEGGCYV